MAVPDKLKINAHVFCYSSDLVDASNKLAEYLKCEVSKVYNGEFKPESQTATVAWLVGHGYESNEIVGNKDDTFGYTIESISDWLKEEGRKYEYLVDTCCYPNMRRKSQTFGDKYYCTDDDQCVMVITGYDNFDTWWDYSNMHDE